MTTILPLNSFSYYAKNAQKTFPKKEPIRRIYCYNCYQYTTAIEPITVRRYSVSRFHIVAQCEKCNKLKSCVIADFDRVKFPSYFFDLKKNEIVMNEFQGKKIINEISTIINE